jgi:hypothetical protein
MQALAPRVNIARAISRASGEAGGRLEAVGLEAQQAAAGQGERAGQGRAQDAEGAGEALQENHRQGTDSPRFATKLLPRNEATTAANLTAQPMVTPSHQECLFVAEKAGSSTVRVLRRPVAETFGPGRPPTPPATAGGAKALLPLTTSAGPRPRRLLTQAADARALGLEWAWGTAWTGKARQGREATVRVRGAESTPNADVAFGVLSHLHEMRAVFQTSDHKLPHGGGTLGLRRSVRQPTEAS